MSPILDSIGSVKGFGWGSFAESSNFYSIASVTIGATSQATIQFTSIPETYTHLHIRAVCRTTGGSRAMRAYFNGDTSTNYMSSQLYGTNSDGIGAAGYTSQSTIVIGLVPRSGYPSQIFGTSTIEIFDYKNSSKYKTGNSFANVHSSDTNEASIEHKGFLWLSTSSINSITFFPDGSTNFPQYSTISLYGIKE